MKSKSQLDAEIAEALRGGNSSFGAMISRVEKAVDAHPELTRQRHDKRGTEEAELIFRGGSWVAEVRLRSKVARGRGSRLMHTARGHGDTPEEAVDDLVESLPITAEALK
ncbi:MAG TPA: hypothetical protein VLE97_11585 [Gaiellaceae bacterium]|nr:hypothetical protein [Gaiellaceae bacterium]